jgi:hypothetical protein
MTEGFEGRSEAGDADIAGVEDGVGLDEFDLLLVEYKAAGLSDNEAASQLGWSSKKVQRHKTDEFKAALAARKAERVAQLAAMLSEAAVDAVATLRDALSGARDADRIRAAVAIVNLLVRLRAEAETETAIEELRGDIAALRRALTGEEEGR